MPNRLIKDSIHTSESVNAMTDFQFRLWINLITYVDDYGRGDARPAVIKGTCFPLRERMTNKDIEAALDALAGIGCVGLYEVDGKPYLYFPNWESHQTVRNKKSKYPAPDCNCNQLQSIASKCSRNPIQSESESKSESKDEEEERARVVLPDVDPSWATFVREYENNIGLLPTSEVERGDLQMFFEEFTADALCEFIRCTARKHPDNPHTYFSAICRKYLGRNIKTAQQAKAVLMDFERQKEGRNGAGQGGAHRQTPQTNPALDYTQRDSQGRASGFSKVYNCETGQWEDIP